MIGIIFNYLSHKLQITDNIHNILSVFGSCDPVNTVNLNMEPNNYHLFFNCLQVYC